MPKQTEGINITARDPETGEAVDTSILQDHDIAFDPTQVHLDLTKEEKRRTTALMMAIQAYDKLIIKDAEMYREISNDNRKNDGPQIKPATMDAMVRAALDFDDFISGKLQARIDRPKATPAKEVK